MVEVVVFATTVVTTTDDVVGAEVLVVAAVQVANMFTITGGGRYPFLALVPFASAATFGLFFSELRGIAEHGAVGATAEEGNVRSHASNSLDRILLHDVNFNFHREHHSYPQYPSCHLPAIQREFAARNIEPAGSMFGTLRSIYVASRTRVG